MPPDQQHNQNYYQYGVFWLYNWFQAENNNMNIFFLMNGNIYNYSLALEQYIWDSIVGYWDVLSIVRMQYHQTHQHLQILENQYLYNHT